MLALGLTARGLSACIQPWLFSMRGYGIRVGYGVIGEWMHIIIYMSRFTRILDEDEIASLFDMAAKRNHQAGITSALLHDGRRLIQAIEGKRDAVATLMTTLESDTRHHQISLVHRSAIQARQFDPWPMRAIRLDPGQSLARLRVQAADLLTSATQVPVKAAFFGFCRYSAKAIPV